MAEAPRFSMSITEAASRRENAGSLPTHSSQKGGRAERGISPAGRGERKESGQAGRKEEWQEGRGPLEGHQQLRDGRSNQSKPSESPLLRVHPAVTRCQCAVRRLRMEARLPHLSPSIQVNLIASSIPFSSPQPTTAF